MGGAWTVRLVESVELELRQASKANREAVEAALVRIAADPVAVGRHLKLTPVPPEGWYWADCGPALIYYSVFATDWPVFWVTSIAWRM